MSPRSTCRVLVPALAAVAAALGPGRASAEGKQACVTAADTGQVARDRGQYRAAREAFLGCARDVCPRIVSQACAGWLRDLDAATPTIVFGAKDETGADLGDFRIDLDATPFVDHLDGKPLAVDPGEHRLHFTRAGMAPLELRLVARSGEKNRLVIVALRHLSSSGRAASTPPAAVVFADAPHSATPEVATLTSLFVLAAGAGGAGLYLFVQSSHDGQQAGALRTGIPSDACTHATSASCGALGADVNAQRSNLVAGEALVGGAGALALAGAAAWLLWPAPRAHTAWVAPSFGPGGGALNVVGTF